MFDYTISLCNYLWYEDFVIILIMKTNEPDGHSPKAKNNLFHNNPFLTPPLNGKGLLSELVGYYIRQKPLYLENLTGCPQTNIYTVFKKFAAKSSSLHLFPDYLRIKLFKGREKTLFCTH